MIDRTRSHRGATHRRRALRAWAIVGILLVLWLFSGIRRLDAHEFGVVQATLVGGWSRLVTGSWALAPPGLLRLTAYPRYGLELALPQAEEAMLRGADGSRFGFRGWITVRPRLESWRELHEASGGRGVEAALLTAVRDAWSRMRPGSERQLGNDALARDLQSALAEALRAIGLDLRRLELDSVDYLAVGQGGEAPRPSGARLLVVGLDGLDWEILDDLLEQDRLPNLARLIDGGVRAKLLTISPMLSPVIWTTIATGVEPSRHGVLDFLVEDPVDKSRQPVTSAQRRAPTVWELLSRAGVQVGVTGWWASWPAEPVRGYLVSDRIAYQLFGFRADPDDPRGKTWPPELYPEIRPLIATPNSVDWETVTRYLSGARRTEGEFGDDERELLNEFRTLLASGESYLAISRHLSERYRPQLEIVYFEGTDTVGHLFMPYRPPLLPGVDEERFGIFREVVDRYYETADAFLGSLIAERGDEWTVMVLSDHGFASDATRPRTTDSRVGHGAAADWHRRFGALILSGAHMQKGVRIEEASVYDIAPTILALFGQPVPRTWPGRVLGSAFEDAFFEEHPVRYRLDDPVRSDLVADGLVDPAAADLLQKLESLGYVSGTGTGTDSVTARNNAGVALMAEGRYDEAEQEFRAGLAASPGSPMLTLNLGLAVRLQGRQDEAAELLRGALEHPTTQRMAGHLLSQILLDRGLLDEAEALLRGVLEKEPGAAEVRNTLGQVLERRGNLEDAESEYLTAADLDPDAAMARNNLGNLARRRGDLENAETWYRRAIEADPYFMGAYNNLALVYQDLGEMERARDLYARAVAKAPENAELLNNLGSWHYAQGDYAEARKLWLRAAAVDPRYPSPLNNLAGLEINAQRSAEAERLLRHALELDPSYGDARINLAIVLTARGQVDEAAEQLRLATGDERTGANSWAKLGALELERGYVDAAIQALERARRLAPRSVEALNYLGEAFRRVGRTREALEVWQESLAIHPDQPRLREYVDRGLSDDAGSE